MSRALFMDDHVDAAITAALLLLRALDVLTVFEDGAAAWSDEQLFAGTTGLERTAERVAARPHPAALRRPLPWGEVR